MGRVLLCPRDFGGDAPVVGPLATLAPPRDGERAHPPLLPWIVHPIHSLVGTMGATMHSTSPFMPNLLSAEQIAELQIIFDQVCRQFGFGPEDKEARDRVAETLMSAAASGRESAIALIEAQQTGREIVTARGQVGTS